MLRRWAVLLAFASCESPPEQAPPALAAFVYPPAPLWLVGPARGVIGRGQAPQVVVRGGITGSVTGRITLPTPWQVPGEGPARAVIYGTLGDAHAIELIDIDAGRVLWRDTTTCAGPVVGVTPEVIVCADPRGVHGLALDGKKRWSEQGDFITMTDERVVLAGAGVAVIVDADLGDEMARVKVPTGITVDSIIAACGDAGRELFASGQDGRLVRIAEAPGGPKIQWAVGTDPILEIDACEGSSIVATVRARGSSERSAPTLSSIARDSGKELGRVNGVLGHWAPRDGEPGIEVSTVTGVHRYSRELTGPGEARETLPLGELLASRGELRLVRATAQTAALLDGRGVRAYLPLAHLGVALGDRSLVASSWLHATGETVHRLPYPERYGRALRFVPGAPHHIVVPAELRDLPALVEVDPVPARSVETELTDVGFEVRGAGGTVARWDLATQAWDLGQGTRAITLVHDADRLEIIDATMKRPLGTFASDTGAPMPAALIDIAGMNMLVTAERGRVNGRLVGAGMVAAWSVEVNGVVTAITAAGEGALVVLEDGDAYRIDGRTGEPTALPGISGDWRVAGDLITSAGDGGPIPVAGWPPPAPAAAAPKGARKRPAKKAVPADDALPPRLITPVPPPPELLPAWQLALYDVTGAVLARNDYALDPPITPGPRTAGAPYVVLSGDDDALEALVLDPKTGDPLRRVRLPANTIPASAFSTVVDGKPLVGALLANPVRLVLF